MTEKITTIEDLAHMINEGFKTTASKEDIKEGRVAPGPDRTSAARRAEAKNRESGDTHEKTRRRPRRLAPERPTTLTGQ
jgi:hypothetical protein